MARLLEYQAKSLLRSAGIPTPRGIVATTPDEARQAAAQLAGPVVVKVQAATTGRKAMGGVSFAATPDEAAREAERMLALRVGQFPVTHVLIEEKLPITRELFVSFAIDDRERCPILLLADAGGTGIEDRAHQVTRVLCDVALGPDPAALRDFAASLKLSPGIQQQIERVLASVFTAARTHEARSVEINPLAVLADARVVALDARATIDDYAVFRHPDLNIEIARELDHPPTALERVAYQIEQEDHRGTFFFAQMNTAASPSSKGLIAFHGAGGGGSMMSMDAITNEGFTIANFCDTSGNPSPAKVYRAARIILSQPGLLGYFGSGSGVANQEQFWSAYGLAKAFWELDLDIPAVIRLGGNAEERAVDILQSSCKAAGLRVPVEGYRKTDTPAKIASRFATLVADHVANGGKAWEPRAPRRPSFVATSSAVRFPVKGGRVWIDTSAWKANALAIIARSNGLLKDDAGKPAPTLPTEALLMKDSDFIACEVECRRDGIDGLFVELDMPSP
jgi:succinyl-CoA synthetase beta subunit